MVGKHLLSQADHRQGQAINLYCFQHLSTETAGQELYQLTGLHRLFLSQLHPCAYMVWLCVRTVNTRDLSVTYQPSWQPVKSCRLLAVSGGLIF